MRHGTCALVQGFEWVQCSSITSSQRLFVVATSPHASKRQAGKLDLPCRLISVVESRHGPQQPLNVLSSNQTNTVRQECVPLTACILLHLSSLQVFRSRDRVRISRPRLSPSRPSARYVILPAAFTFTGPGFNVRHFNWEHNCTLVSIVEAWRMPGASRSLIPRHRPARSSYRFHSALLA